jgi:MFS family permease
MNARLLAQQTRVVRVAVADRNIALLAASLGAWVAAEWAFLLALSVHAYALGGVQAVGVVGALRILPTAIFAPWAAVLADRYSRNYLLAVIHAVWAVQLVVLALLAYVDAPLALVYAVVVVGALVAAPFRPTINALVPQLVKRPEELTAANAVYGGTEAIGTLLGPLLAGGLLAIFAPPALFAFIALMCATGAVASLGIRSPFRPAREYSPRPTRASSLLAGFSALVAQPAERTIFTLFMGQGLMRGLLNVFIVSAAAAVLGLGDSGTGLLFAALGLGGLAGALLGIRIVTPRRLGPAFVAGVSAWGIALIAIAAWPIPIFACMVLIGLGLGNAVEDIAGVALLQRVIPDHRQGRAFGAFWGAAGLTIGLGSVLAPPLVAALGLRWAMAVSGFFLCTLVAFGWARIRMLEQTSAPEGATAALRSQPIFAPLPPLVLERLARALHSTRVSAGETVVRQGSPGDRFYVIDQGVFSVVVDSREVRHLGPGDAFGETALLREMPRTATVSATSDGRLWWLEPDVFVPAVTGHRASSVAATRVIDEHLARARPAASV